MRTHRCWQLMDPKDVSSGRLVPAIF
jgi:hypothetical protein